ncbi:putative LRR receptor-like serine/threonine-protein kinase At1g05700 [Curcuma longa]|uniref:putative LRR receptor-like serine/threonine-protein kinase At1g05700 n=1 Tax=Curcuma longa TaxID=136217 RepID=UPI003D9F98CC
MTISTFSFLVLGIACIINTVHGEPFTDGFISIDCGISSAAAYNDSITNIPYVSDDQFINTGVKANISASFFSSSLARQLSTLRSFPGGSRSCYLLNVTQGQKYLVRAIFMYGNYDGRNRASVGNPLRFDLYLDYNLWKIVKLTGAAEVHRPEAIFVASAHTVSVCLIKTGTGIPFISVLELRPLDRNMYPYTNESQSVALTYRYNVMPTTNSSIRFPPDAYDRIWEPVTWHSDWDMISTTCSVRSNWSDYFRPPSAVMQTAATPSTNSSKLHFQFDYVNMDALVNQFYFIFHFSELLPNTKREFNIYLNDQFWYANYSPPHLVAGNVHNTVPSSDGLHYYRWSLDSSGVSPLPPILNALEVYTPMYHTNVPTDSVDVDAITTIMGQYQLKKNWIGDPCAPKGYAWDGLNCSYTSNSTSIETVNLSSSALAGAISDSFGRFTRIKYLDLSYNNLTGKLPKVLGTLSSLEVLNLTGNNLNGSVPDSLLQKSQNGSLILILEGNPNLVCTKGTSCDPTTDIRKAKKIPTLTIVAVCVLLPVVLLLVALYIRLRIKAKGLANNCLRVEMEVDRQSQLLQFENRTFTSQELITITNNFQRVIGKGGSGVVYHGYMEDGTQVAVKKLSQKSSQGTNEFIAEVQHLLRIHHKNLVSMVGYCMEGDYQALIYEYMVQGTLQDHIRGKIHSAIAFDWGKRLQIAIEAAQGLEYLHYGCKPPLVHRDVKTANILLSERLEAKIADFGLSKAIQNYDEASDIMTMTVVGTIGYLDPNYHSTFQLSEKSDVYSFGVVLLELITAEPPILEGMPDAEVHIRERVEERLKTRKIEEIVDSKLENKCDISSIRKAVDLAFRCTSRILQERPSMGNVITDLRESLQLQSISFRGNENLQMGSDEVSQNSAQEMEQLASSCPSAR